MVGLKQGEVLFPVLLSLLLEDLEVFLQDDPLCGLSIDVIVLFADDMILFGDSHIDLQHRLDMLKSYCDRWGLIVNTEKTKVMVFRKRGNTIPNELWHYGGSNLEVVDNFNYLSTVCSYNGYFKLNQEILVVKGLKALMYV